MNNKIKNTVVIVCFILFISGFMLVNIFMPDEVISLTERRKLKTVPEYSSKRLFNGELFEELEKYSLDQFALRDSFRSLKAYFRYYLLKQKDNNKIYIINSDNINKMDYPLNENSVHNVAEKLNDVCSKYFQGMNVSYAIIPDKNYFVAAQNGYLSIDYVKMIKIMNQNVNNMNYIDIFGSLSIEDFYNTDIHWRQEKIPDIAHLLMTKMGNDVEVSETDFLKKELYPFYGSYYGQAALKVKPDTLTYLINNTIENSEVYDLQFKTYSKVYEPEKFEDIDPYNIFLSGARPIISVTNPECTTDKELILFRDSFGSSIAPLLLKGYSKITLIDLRYINSDYLKNYIEFTTDPDVLFLYNTQVLNNSYMLK